jgi:hypothetical protein
LRPVLGNGNDLVTQGVDVGYIGIGNFCTHGKFCSCLEDSLKVFGEDGCKIGCGCTCSEALKHGFRG